VVAESIAMFAIDAAWESLPESRFGIRRPLSITITQRNEVPTQLELSSSSTGPNGRVSVHYHSRQCRNRAVAVGSLLLVGPLVAPESDEATADSHIQYQYSAHEP